MARPIFAHIDTDALKHNLGVIRNHAGTARIMAVIKANGYGHGMAKVARALWTTDGFAVASIDEAIQLRELGWLKPILLLEGVFGADEIAACVNHRIAITVHHFDQIRMLQASKPAQSLALFLKLNSGMNRLGFEPQDFLRALAQLQAMQTCTDITLMSHFATADDAYGIADQLQVIQTCFDELPYPVSLANSAALFRYPASRGDWVRPGIALYGASPFADTAASALDLRPAMTLHSRIIAVQTLKPGDALGYGRTWIADRPSRIGVVACGYADGYPRHAPTGTPILVNGQLTRTLGRVSMDMMFADLTGLPDADAGSAVILWGKGLPVESVASAAGTISYELLCARAQRVPDHE
ncbi:alanine racemase [Sulfuriferula sp. AH1]|uniref:alanine racemase n=1 Tax=Sulfuriferula sp. AH1 TaxID=1985873 RepID=UPI000B3B7A6C|nr:alanine racemase [Sulfuriferula sp. AH1]ARU32654.1 alanine racemase [Sulfuriferula sp. AH1]